MKTKNITNLILITFFLFACQKKKTILSTEKSSRNNIVLENFSTPSRIGLGNLNENFVLDLLKFDQLTNLDDDIYVFTIHFNQRKIYETTLEKNWDWMQDGFSILKIMAPLDAKIEKEANYPLILNIKKKSNHQTVFEKTMPINIEHYTLRNEKDLEQIESFNLAGNYVLGNDIQLTKSWKPIAIC